MAGVQSPLERILAACALLQVLAQAPSAEAQTPGAIRRARALFSLGVRQYDRGHFQQALRAFSTAYDTVPAPVTVFNIAQCHLGLGHDHEAAANLRLYLSQEPSAPNAAEARRLLRQVESRLGQRRHEARQEMLAEVRLEQRRMERHEAVDDEVPPSAVDGALEAREETPTGGSVRALTWLTLAGGVIVAGVGGLFALDAAAKQSDLDDPELDCRRAIEECVDLVDAGDRSALLRTSLLAAGAAALTLGTILIVVDLSSDGDARDSLSLRPRLGPSMAGLEVGGAW